MDSPEVINKSIYELTLDHLDRRLMPTKFQLVAALMDPTMANMIFLGEEIDTRFDSTRSELLQFYLTKYKFDDLEIVDLTNSDSLTASTSTDSDSVLIPRSVS